MLNHQHFKKIFMPPTTKKRSRVDLQERDLDIFETIYDLRFATLNHLAVLFPSTNQKLINTNAEFKAGQKAIANRISKLARQKLGYYYLKRIGYPLRLGTQPSVYTIDEKAGRVLADQRGYDLSDLLKQVKRNEKYFDHQGRPKDYCHSNPRRYSLCPGSPDVS